MKKAYQKPYLGVESFQLNAAVATMCSQKSGGIAINHWESNCSFANGQFFSYYNCAIDVTDAAVDGNDTLCYHGPTLSGGVVFAFS